MRFRSATVCRGPIELRLVVVMSEQDVAQHYSQGGWSSGFSMRSPRWAATRSTWIPTS